MKMKAKSLRPWVQGLFFLLVVITLVSHELADQGIEVPLFASASLHSICPFGGVVTLYQLGTVGTYIQKIHESSLILMIAVFATAFLIGPAFCGWVCPFGSFQELVAKLGRPLRKRVSRKLRGTRLEKVLAKADLILGAGRYLVLGWVLYVTARTGVLVFADYDPYFALFNFYSGEVAISALVILGVVALLGLFVERPFCRYGCPYGAVLGLTNLIRVFPLRRNKKTCIDCKLCNKNCPMGIDVASKSTVRDLRCISCLECTSDRSCPKPNTLELKFKAYKAEVTQ